MMVRIILVARDGTPRVSGEIDANKLSTLDALYRDRYFYRFESVSHNGTQTIMIYREINVHTVTEF